MTDIVIKADMVIKSLLAAIIVMGGLVWNDLRNQSVKATNAALEAADSSAAALSEIKDAVKDQDRRIDSLERIVYGGNGGGKFAPPFRARGRARDSDRRGGPFSVPHKQQIEPAPSAPPERPEQPKPDKAEPPDWKAEETAG